MVSGVQVVLVRHGEVDYAATDRFDPVYRGARGDFAPLTAAGVEQVRATARGLALADPVIVSSPYTRTVQTAAILACHFGTDFGVDPGLHDWLPVRRGDIGYASDVFTERIAEYRAWKATGDLPAGRTWETDEEMRARLAAAIQRHRTDAPLVLVTHEGVIRSVTGAPVIPLASAHPLDIRHRAALDHHSTRTTQDR
jgi:broad specificity phosphatase PhoE